MSDSDLVYALRPLLSPLLLPPTPPLIMALIGGWLAWRQRAAGLVLLAVGLVSGWLICTERVAEFMLNRLLHPPAALSFEAIGRLAAERAAGHRIGVLVLGGGTVEHASEYGGADLNASSIERLRYGVWLARQLGAPLGFSGGIGHGRESGRPAEADIARQVAEQQFATSLRWIESRSRDTRENARLSVPLLRHDGVDRLVVVSHRAHLPRVVRAFAAVNDGTVEVVAAGVDNRDPSQPYSWGDWVPSTHGFRKSRSAIAEWLGWIAGR